MAREIRVGGLRIDIGVGFEEVRKGLDSVEKRLQNFGKSLNNLTKNVGGPKLELGLKASFAGIGAIALKAGKDFDDAQAKIIRSTGAAGAQLDQFKTSLVNAFAGNDDSVQEVASALADVSVKTGLAGKSLEQLTGKFLDLNDITGQDTNSIISASAKIFESWGVAVKDQTKTLDLFLAANQKFGVNFGQLEETLVSSGATFRELGFTLEDTTLLLANMSKEGVNVEGVLAGLKKGVANFVEKGKSPAESLERVLSVLKQLGDQKGLEVGKKLFGKSFLDVLDAVKKGAFEIDKAKAQLGDFDNQIAKTAEASQTLGQKLTVFWNNLSTMFAPIGTAIVDTLKSALDYLNGNFFNDFSKGFNANSKLIGVSIDVVTDHTVAKFKLAFELVYEYAKYAFDRIIDYIAQVGASIANLIRTMASVSTLATNPGGLFSGQGLSTVAENYERLKESITGIGQQGEAASRTLAKIEELKQSAAKFGMTSEQQQKIAAIRGEIDQLGQSADAADKPTRDLGGGLGDLTGDAQKASDALKKINEQLESFRSQETLSAINENITNAFTSGNLNGLDEYKQQLYDYTYQATLDGLKDSIKEGGATALTQAQVLAGEKASAALKDVNKRQVEELKKQLQGAADFFSDALYNVFTGQSFDFKDIGKRFAAGLVGGILGGLFPGAGGFGDLQGIGKTIGLEIMNGLGGFLKTEGKGILSDIFGGSGGLLSSIFGGGISDLFSNITGGRPAGVQGPLMESGKFAAPSASTLGIAAAAAATAAFVYDTNSKNFKGDNKAKTYGTLALDMMFPGVGSLISKTGIFGGSKNPQEVAREEAIAKLTEAIEKLGSVSFFDSQGKLNTVSKLNVGDSDQFNAPGWATKLQDQFGANTTNAFFGIGEALRQTLGITEDIGGQIGAMLLQNVGGSIDGLKEIIAATGLTYDKFIETMITEGKKGQDSWLTIVSEINAGTEAFQKGLSGTGKFVQAFQNVLATAGKGGQALTQLQNIATEAKEAGITALSDLQSKLIQSGQFTKIEIDALFNALAQQNIKTLDDLGKATDLQLASSIAAIDAYFQDNGDGWANIQEQISKTSDAISKINGQNIQLTFDVKSNLDDSTKALIENGVLTNNEFQIDLPSTEVEAMASGGILRGPTMIRPGALAGEAGPEAVLPLKNVNGRLGVAASGLSGRGAAGITINVYAPNATPGMETAIANALDSMEERLQNNIHSAVADMMGGF